MVSNINPFFLQWGDFSIRWYGVFLGLGVGLAMLVVAKLFKDNKIPVDLVFTISSYLILSGLIGARLGYIIFYNLSFYLNNSKEIFYINHGGLSSHGMALGIIICLFVLYKKRKIEKIMSDLVIISLPIIIAFIRLGNFFNSELVGRKSNGFWAVKFPGYTEFRHPVQIYEMITALILFFVLYFIYKRFKTPVLFITWLFVLLYFSSRFILEFFKEYQFLSSGLTMGQWLCLPFIVWSIIWLIYKKHEFFKLGKF